MTVSKLKNRLTDIPIYFLVALPRSGSTLLYSMINQHDSILAILEEPFYLNLNDKYSKIENWTVELISDYIDDFYLFANNKSKAQLPERFELFNSIFSFNEKLTWEIVVRLTFFSFKNPLEKKITCIVCKELAIHNHLEKISKLFPTSKFIFLHRNPLDNIARWKDFRKKRIHKNDSIEKIATKWYFRTTKILNFKKIVSSDRVLTLKYCDLIINPEKELIELCRFLNVSYQIKMLHYPDTIKQSIELVENQGVEFKKQFTALHSSLLSKPMTSKIGIWKDEITTEEASKVWSIVSVPSLELGYEKPELIKHKNQTISVHINILIKKIIIGIWWNSPFRFRKFLKKIKHSI